MSVQLKIGPDFEANKNGHAEKPSLDGSFLYWTMQKNLGFQLRCMNKFRIYLSVFFRNCTKCLDLFFIRSTETRNTEADICVTCVQKVKKSTGSIHFWVSQSNLLECWHTCFNVIGHVFKLSIHSFGCQQFTKMDTDIWKWTSAVFSSTHLCDSNNDFFGFPICFRASSRYFYVLSASENFGIVINHNYFENLQKL